MDSNPGQIACFHSTGFGFGHDCPYRQVQCHLDIGWKLFGDAIEAPGSGNLHPKVYSSTSPASASAFASSVLEIKLGGRSGFSTALLPMSAQYSICPGIERRCIAAWISADAISSLENSATCNITHLDVENSTPPLQSVRSMGLSGEITASPNFPTPSDTPPASPSRTSADTLPSYPVSIGRRRCRCSRRAGLSAP